MTMGETWTVTFGQGNITPRRGDEPTLMRAVGEGAEASGRTELRDEDGQIIRLAEGAEIAMIDSPVGRAAQTYGEVFYKGLSLRGHHKYRTSCWVGVKQGVRADVLARPTGNPNEDEFLFLEGSGSIWEFDLANRPFTIVDVDEGHKAILTYDPDEADPRKRYRATTAPVTADDYDHALRTYYDPRRWR
jgi:hypothetical protein